jgi:TPP-dependent indolepyruvate ferredoxin oxidoreductase alpha subunit
MDPRFLKEQGTSIFTGNELIVKGALENGVGEITGYPGSPLAELFDTLESISELLDNRPPVQDPDLLAVEPPAPVSS